MTHVSHAPLTRISIIKKRNISRHPSQPLFFESDPLVQKKDISAALAIVEESEWTSFKGASHVRERERERERERNNQRKTKKN
jgi:hypothetical protein